MSTLREQAREAVIAAAPEYSAHEHHRNWHKLHVYRTGKVEWSEHINRSDDFIDREARGFQAIPSVARVGTGSYVCNCDYCGDTTGEYEDLDDAISNAVGDSDLVDIERDMLEEFDNPDNIPPGYFADEEEPEAELTEDQYD
jgi:predicted Mrr-cat superfamily restriction endonuclease